jgi:ubiquinone/menaquinone biosynthesis C-methylase UbiE
VWQRQAVPVLAEAVRGYYATQGISTSAQDVKTTIATNTELVPTRVETISRFLRELQGVESLRGMRVLDLGGGFGAFAVYLALDPDAPLITTVDVRQEFVDTGRDVTARLGLQNLDFKLADMRKLNEFEDAQFDLVILNNSFLYLVTKDDMRQSISEIARVMRPGAHVVFFHANRWKLREPFTRAPIVHLLPPRVADSVSSVTGWRHNHGRVLLVSPVWLARQLRRGGFADVCADGPGARRVLPRAWFAKFYAVTGRKPDRAGGR